MLLFDARATLNSQLSACFQGVIENINFQKAAKEKRGRKHFAAPPPERRVLPKGENPRVLVFLHFAARGRRPTLISLTLVHIARIGP
jgi:hypothetical protein